MAKLTCVDRQKIVCLHRKGCSQRAIAQETGFSRCAVQAVIKKFEETGEVKDRQRSGRPKKLSASDEQYLKDTCLKEGRKSSDVLAHNLEELSGTKVHSSTVRRCLVKNGFVAARKQPLLGSIKPEGRYDHQCSPQADLVGRASWSDFALNLGFFEAYRHTCSASSLPSSPSASSAKACPLQSNIKQERENDHPCSPQPTSPDSAASPRSSNCNV